VRCRIVDEDGVELAIMSSAAIDTTPTRQVITVSGVGATDKWITAQLMMSGPTVSGGAWGYLRARA